MDKKKIQIIALILLGLLMVGLIPATVYLTGGRDVGEFTAGDKRVLAWFLVAEVLIFAAMLWLANKIGRANRAAHPERFKGEQPTETDRVLHRRAIWLQILALVLTMLAYFAGLVLGKTLGEGQRKTAEVLAISLPAFAVLLGAVSYGIERVRARPFERMSVKDLQDWLQSHREQAERVAEEKLRLLRRIRLGSDALAVILILVGLSTAFALGASFRTSMVVPVLLAAMLTDLGLTRFRFPAPKTVLQDGFDLLDEQEYPRLYALARRAARASGREAPLCIVVTPDDNAGIGKIGELDLIQLGVILLNLLSEEELYTVLLHEYGHTGDRRVERETDYADWLENVRDRHMLTFASKYFYSLPDDLYGLHYGLFRFAYSIGAETRADRAMAELGDARMAASALLKTHYADLYQFEESALEHPDRPNFASLIHAMLEERLEKLQAAIRERAELYNGLIHREIRSRTASHPLQRERLAALGVTEYAILEDRSPEAYREETKRALQWLEERMIRRSDPEDYRSYHEELCKRVERWENEGRPLDEESYPDTVAALKELGRLHDAMELCRRAIDELPEGSSRAFAQHMRGCWLLHSWDASGIDLIYSAIETNHNYLQEGLEQIGLFCCLSGNQTELDRYREMAPVLMQQEKDVFSQIGVLQKGDMLSAEELPEELRERILASLREIDHGQIEAAYLLHKQISPDFSTSPMIVRFREETDPDTEEETLHRIFLCLDAVEGWQFSLFSYEEAKRVKPEEIEGTLFYTGRKREE